MAEPRAAHEAATQYSPNAFAYNGRVALALVPAVVYLIGAGGNISVYIITIGAMIAYLLDALRVREGALVAVWLTLLVVNFGLLFSGDIFNGIRPWSQALLLYATAGEVFFLFGLWGTLQFRWLQLQHPGVVLAAERLLFASCPIMGSVVQTWGIASATGAENAPFYLLMLSAGYYYLFSVPTKSSFVFKAEKSLGGTYSAEMYVLGRTESALQMMMFVVTPPVMYVILHLPTLFEQYTHLWSLLLLCSLPALFVCFCSRFDGLWWTDLPPEALGSLVWVVAATALVAGVAGLEGRIIFRAFSRYLLVPPPWSYLLVSVALYGATVLLAGHFLGAIGPQLGGPVAMTVLLMSALAASLAAGVPLWGLPAPLFSAGGLASFYATGEVRDYLVFVGGAALSFAWFLSHHFWFLDVTFGGLPLAALCRLLLLLLALLLLTLALSSSSGCLVPTSHTSHASHRPHHTPEGTPKLTQHLRVVPVLHHGSRATLLNLLQDGCQLGVVLEAAQLALQVLTISGRRHPRQHRGHLGILHQLLPELLRHVHESRVLHDALHGVHVLLRVKASCGCSGRTIGTSGTSGTSGRALSSRTTKALLQRLGQLCERGIFSDLLSHLLDAGVVQQVLHRGEVEGTSGGHARDGGHARHTRHTRGSSGGVFVCHL
uniref:Uncharacterized protein n=1 Tax=Pyramimonas obovata TaxID=1411642 RepID=A0A7S0WJN6_9CHLO|mmetsp:Transcript_27319/g.59693  ORF Transcript_27319/g.59693 Transcript_27319/m.59693 type:complete len:659 (+) Transcript_27319:257-2233(+)